MCMRKYQNDVKEINVKKLHILYIYIYIDLEKKVRDVLCKNAL